MASRSKGWNCYFASARRWFLWSELALQFSGSVVLFGRMECDARRSQIIQNATSLHTSKLRRSNIRRVDESVYNAPYEVTTSLYEDAVSWNHTAAVSIPHKTDCHWNITFFFSQLINYFCLLLPFSCNIVAFLCLILSIQWFLFGLKAIFIVLDLILADMAAFKCHFYKPNLVFHATGAESLLMVEYTVCYISFFLKRAWWRSTLNGLLVNFCG